MKRCGKCGYLKGKEAFAKNVGHRDGLHSKCKSCHAEDEATRRKADPEHYEKKRIWYRKNSKKVKEQVKASRLRHLAKVRAYDRERYRVTPGRKEKTRAIFERWQAAHPEETKQIQRVATRRWREKNLDRVRANQRAWIAKNPERYAELLRRGHVKRKARLRGARISGEIVSPAKVFARDCWICQLCGLPTSKASVTIDHIVPIARGGEHSMANVQTAHLSCNASKGARRVA